MKQILLICILSLISFAECRLSGMHLSPSRFAHKKEDSCEGFEEIDLSEFNLSFDDLRANMPKSQAHNLMSQNLETNPNDKEAQIIVSESSLSSSRKMIILANDTKMNFRVLKTSTSDAELSSHISGSPLTSMESGTSGTGKFNVGITTVGTKAYPHTTVSGQMDLSSNSSSQWHKRHGVDEKKHGGYLMTNTSSASDSNVEWAIDNSDKSESIAISTESTSMTSTAILSKSCFASRIGAEFKTQMKGTKWSKIVEGKGKGGTYTHVLYSSKNGSSLTWTFSKLRMRGNIIMGDSSNDSMSGTEYVTIKSFTETITRPLGQGSFEIINEIKVRVEVKSTLESGVKIYSESGHVAIRNSVVTIPSLVRKNENSDESVSDENNLDEESEIPQREMRTFLHKHLHSNNLINNHEFLKSMMTHSSH